MIFAQSSTLEHKLVGIIIIIKSYSEQDYPCAGFIWDVKLDPVLNEHLITMDDVSVMCTC